MRARMVCAILVIYSECKFREMDYDGATDEHMMEAYTYNSENHY
jgi:hypothetical protein